MLSWLQDQIDRILFLDTCKEKHSLAQSDLNAGFRQADAKLSSILASFEIHTIDLTAERIRQFMATSTRQDGGKALRMQLTSGLAA